MSALRSTVQFNYKSCTFMIDNSPCLIWIEQQAFCFSPFVCNACVARNETWNASRGCCACARFLEANERANWVVWSHDDITFVNQQACHIATTYSKGSLCRACATRHSHLVLLKSRAIRESVCERVGDLFGIEDFVIPQINETEAQLIVHACAAYLIRRRTMEDVSAEFALSLVPFWESVFGDLSSTHPSLTVEKCVWYYLCLKSHCVRQVPSSADTFLPKLTFSSSPNNQGSKNHDVQD
jgi:hypothetical protein